MATDVTKLVDQLGKMTVLELVELKNALEEQWGVTAAAPVAVAAAPGAAAAGGDGAAAADEEQTAFDVVLTAAGEKLARNIAHRHRLLTDFLQLLGLSDRVIHHDVEGMEHHISAPTLKAIQALTSQLRRRPGLRAQLRTASA